MVTTTQIKEFLKNPVWLEMVNRLKARQQQVVTEVMETAAAGAAVSAPAVALYKALGTIISMPESMLLEEPSLATHDPLVAPDDDGF